jgi:phosphatidylserine synthase
MVLYLFAFTPPPVVSLLIVGFFVLLTFVLILAVHPFRVAELHVVTLPATAPWVAAAIGAVANPFSLRRSSSGRRPPFGAGLLAPVGVATSNLPTEQR